MRHSLHFGLGRLRRLLLGGFNSLTGQVGRDAFDCGGTEGLGDGLLPTAPTTAASTTTTASTPTLTFLPRCCRARLLVRIDGFFARGLRFYFGLGDGRNFSLVITRLEIV